MHRVLLVVDGLDDMDARLLAFEVMTVSCSLPLALPFPLLLCPPSLSSSVPLPSPPLSLSRALTRLASVLCLEGIARDRFSFALKVCLSLYIYTYTHTHTYIYIRVMTR